MEARLQQRVQRYGWNRAAHRYEALWGQQIQPAQDLLLKLADLRHGQRVLDVACGSGLVTLPAAQTVGATGFVVGTDISETMLQVAADAATQAGRRNIEFIRMAAESLEFDDVSFDAVLCSLGMMYFPHPDESLREMYRVSKPGAATTIAVWGARKNCGWASIFPIVDARVRTEVCPLFFGLGSGDALARCFEQAGFSDVRTERLTTTLHYISAEEACGAAFAGGPVALAYSRFDDQTREEAHREYTDSIEPYRKGQEYEIPGEFVVCHGRK